MLDLPNDTPRFSILILAAGKATRFKSERAKALHPLAGRPLGAYLVEASIRSGPERLYMVVGHDADRVRQAFARQGLAFITQREQRGTGDAVRAAYAELERCPSPSIIVLVGDAPLLNSQTLSDLVRFQQTSRAAAAVLSVRLNRPEGYGRIVRGPGDRLRAIIEEKDATPAQKRIHEVNSGILCFSRPELLEHINELTDTNSQKEFLLTDLVHIFNRRRLKVAVYPLANSQEVLGVNDRVELARVERILRRRKARELMASGVTIVDPKTVVIDDGVRIGRDSRIAAGVHLLGRTTLGKECDIQPFSVLTDTAAGDRVTVRPFTVIAGCEVASEAVVGPFAHLRDGAVVETGARVGNFVEVKKSRLGRGTKSLHLTYLGDATVGEEVNIGAGTVTCNYDGQKKSPTVIERGAFIGSGSMLVAPLRVGQGSYVAAGSTITDDVPPESLAVARARQVNKEGWAKARPNVTPQRPAITRPPARKPSSALSER